jgi:hypothetical protein
LTAVNRKKLRVAIQDEVARLGYRHIQIMSYQKLQNLKKKGSVPVPFDYVIFDEIHYVTSDSFNKYTDITFSYLRNLVNKKNNVCIFMSATSKYFFKWLLDEKKVKKKRYYVHVKDYSYVDKVYFYKAKALTSIIDDILLNKPSDKIIVFCNSDSRMMEMYNIYRDNAYYVCSERNKNEELLDICNNNCITRRSDDYITFDKRILFTTKCMDNGIDLKDANIKHIFTEIFDLESMVQSLGRKRSLNLDDTCTFYIKNYTAQGISYFGYKIKKHLDVAEMLKKNEVEFNKKYGTDREKMKSNDIFYMDFNYKGNADNITRTNGKVQLNNMIYLKYHFDYQEIAEMIETDYLTVACKWLGEELSKKVEVLEVDIEEHDLFYEYIESIKGKYLFKEEKEELKEEFRKIGLRDRTMGINTLNGKLKDKKYSFYIESIKDVRRKLDNGSDNPNRNKQYWIVKSVG